MRDQRAAAEIRALGEGGEEGIRARKIGGYDAVYTASGGFAEMTVGDGMNKSLLERMDRVGGGNFGVENDRGCAVRYANRGQFFDLGRSPSAIEHSAENRHKIVSLRKELFLFKSRAKYRVTDVVEVAKLREGRDGRFVINIKDRHRARAEREDIVKRLALDGQVGRNTQDHVLRRGGTGQHEKIVCLFDLKNDCRRGNDRADGHINILREGRADALIKWILHYYSPFDATNSARAIAISKCPESC